MNLTTPVIPSADIQLIQADSYKQEDGRAPTWSDTTDWPVLTGATVVFNLLHPSGATEAYTATVDSATQVHVDLTSAQTKALDVGGWRYALKALIADGDVVTLAVGNVIVVAPPIDAPSS